MCYSATTGYNACAMFQVTPKWNADCDTQYAQTPHPGGMNLCMADGSVRNISDRVQPATWQRACDPRDALPMPNDW